MELVRPAVLSAGALAGAVLLIAPMAAEAAPQMRTAATQGATRLVTESGEASVYMKRPKGDGTWPGVILLHDSMGLTRGMTTTADRLSADGFVVYAPDLYGGKIALDADKGRELSVLMDEEGAMNTVEALAAYLKTLKEVGDHRVGLVGFDLGGRLGLRAAMGSRDISALAIADARPQSDPDALRRIGCPILALFGGKDESITRTDTAGFEAALKTAGRTSEVRVFESSGHGFMLEGNPAYNAPDAGDAWGRLVAFLKEHL